ncbi:hypothetical protein ACFE04_031198 [Oxalis oulophora]
MGRWRRPKTELNNQNQELHHQGGTRSSYSRKPPIASWQPTVPAWEKKFCTSVGCMSWDQLLEGQRFVYLYDNILQWNDCAAKEAFNNAKNRFWSEVNGFPCNIPPPDPDKYIDKIDWDSEIDPELLLDLEKDPEIPDETKKSKEVVVIIEESILNPAFTYSPTGWGDAEENLPKAENNGNNIEKFWEKEYVHDESQGWNRWDCNDDWDNNKFTDNNSSDQKAAGDCWGAAAGYDNNFNNGYTENNIGKWQMAGDWGGYENREVSGSNSMSRYKTTRVYHDDHPVNQGRRGKRVDFASNRWNVVNSCQPVGHY